jgi:hypothetical protein
MRGFAISFLTPARVAAPVSFLRFLWAILSWWHRDGDHAVPFRTVAKCMQFDESGQERSDFVCQCEQISSFDPFMILFTEEVWRTRFLREVRYTLGGRVPSDGDKSQAESIAKSIAGVQVVSNQIGVISPAAESEAKTVNSDLDKGIEKNLDAALIQRRLNKSVKYDVKNGVVTLTGEVNSQSRRAKVEKVASTVPNVQQAVNELQVKDQKATSSH